MSPHKISHKVNTNYIKVWIFVHIMKRSEGGRFCRTLSLAQWCCARSSLSAYNSIKAFVLIKEWSQTLHHRASLCWAHVLWTCTSTTQVLLTQFQNYCSGHKNK
jgi:hypothetical protein